MRFLTEILSRTGLDTIIRKLSSSFEQTKQYRHTDFGLLFIAAVLGLFVGLAVTAFHYVVMFVGGFFDSALTETNNYFHIGRFAFPLVTALGGLVVGILNTRVFHQLPGQDMHSIVEALEKYDGRIHWGHSIRAITTAAVTITSGGGGGREGPTILLGGSVGSGIAQILRLRESYIKVLCVAGTAAAVSGIFNAPLAGIIFSLEALTGNLSLGLFIPIVIASVLSTAVSNIFLGSNPEIVVPAISSPVLWQYALITLIGIFSGLTALFYLKSYRVTTRFTQQHLLKNIPPIWKPALGGLLVGIMAAFLPTMLETTYHPIGNAVNGNMVAIVAFATIFFKPINNAVTLSSGGAGGTFAPVLKVGAVMGMLCAFGYSELTGEPYTALFALIGAAAVLAGSWRLPLTGAILMCEISHNYNFLLPLLLACVISVFIVERSRSSSSFEGTFNPLDEHTPSQAGSETGMPSR